MFSMSASSLYDSVYDMSGTALASRRYAYDSSTNGVEDSIAPLAWRSLPLIKCQILASLFVVFRFTDFAFLASWASCGSVWFVRQQGSAAQPRWGAHFSGRVQERILNMAIVRDARAVAFESVYVQVSVHACQQVVRLQDSPPHGTRRSEPEPQESRPSSVMTLGGGSVLL